MPMAGGGGLHDPTARRPRALASGALLGCLLLLWGLSRPVPPTGSYSVTPTAKVEWSAGPTAAVSAATTAPVPGVPRPRRYAHGRAAAPTSAPQDPRATAPQPLAGHLMRADGWVAAGWVAAALTLGFLGAVRRAAPAPPVRPAIMLAVLGRDSEEFHPAMVKLREQWKFRGKHRPYVAVPPKPGQESVWDYPRPPRLEPVASQVVIRRKETGALVCRTSRALRVCETASPPTYYVPLADIDPKCGLRRGGCGGTLCEWKGRWWAWDLPGLPDAGWGYPQPWTGFELLKDHVAFYAGKVDCWVGGEKAVPRLGSLRRGEPFDTFPSATWLSGGSRPASLMVGPFKGEPGIEGC